MNRQFWEMMMVEFDTKASVDQKTKETSKEWFKNLVNTSFPICCCLFSSSTNSDN